MTEPKLLSAEELERHLTEGSTSEHNLRGHIAALLEEHRKALVRARNEGLEMAAVLADEKAKEADAEAGAARRNKAPMSSVHGWAMSEATAVDLAEAIRAKKEKET